MLRFRIWCNVLFEVVLAQMLVHFLGMSFELSERLQAGGFDFGSHAGCRVLLKNNALYPWFVLVPEVAAEVEELSDMERGAYDRLMELVYDLSQFMREYFSCEKVNVGCVGIVVRQLHVHVVGRNEGDPAWPGVVWGAPEKTLYDAARVVEIQQAFKNKFE